MPNNFRNINYGTLLFETLRHYFSVNAKTDELTILYTYLAAILAPLQQPFNDYNTFRVREALIAQCKWQIGQLTNVLNFLFDSTLNRIFITQATILPIVDPEFAYPPNNFDMTFSDTPPEIFEVEFSDRTLETLVTINVPVSADLNDLTAVVNQIKVQGVPYRIVTF